MNVGILLVALLCAGCAGEIVRLVRPHGSGQPCVPFEMVAFGDWQPGPAQMVAVEDEDGNVLPAVRRAYRLPSGDVVMALWVEGRIVLIDPAPDDPTTPAWADRGLLAEGKTIALRRDRDSRLPCDWKKTGGLST